MADQQKIITLPALVRALVQKVLAVAGALVRGWRTHTEGTASRRNDVIKFLEMAEDMLAKYKAGKESIDMVEMSITAAKQVVYKDIEFDSFIVEYLGDVTRMIDQSQENINATGDIGKLLQENHEFDNRFIERHDKLKEALNNFDNTVILNPPKGPIMPKDQ